jgi:hypothetical protein
MRGKSPFSRAKVAEPATISSCRSFSANRSSAQEWLAAPPPSPTPRSAHITPRLVAQIGEDRVRSGDHPLRRRSTVTEPLVAEVEATLASGNGHADPAQVRPRLAEAAAASLDDIQAALLDAALGATRDTWVTTACSGLRQEAASRGQDPGRSVEGGGDRTSLARGPRASTTGRGGGESSYASHG